MNFRQHFAAICLSVAASTDNFLVGLSEGLARHSLKISVLWGIAASNALGGFVSSSFGHFIVQYVSVRQQFILTGVGFSLLALQEYFEATSSTISAAHNNSSGQLGAATTAKSESASLALALPMTLNNVAGGIAGGVLGISPNWNFIYALIVSVLTMWLGYKLGTQARKTGMIQTQRLSIALYLYLSAQSFYQASVS